MFSNGKMKTLADAIVQHPRIKREKKTIDAMVQFFCKKKHKAKGELCPECTEFLAYAMLRLDRCPFQERKSTWESAPSTATALSMREKAKNIMRYSGPRMLLHHPGLALHHVGRTQKTANAGQENSRA